MSLAVFYTDCPLADAQLGEVLTVTGSAAHHAVTVRRLGIGSVLELTDGAGLRVRGELTAAAKDAMELRVSAVESEERTTPRFGLVQALAKGDRDLAAIEAATEIGVDTVIPWQAQRSIVQWRGARTQRAHAKWRSVITAAAQQSRRCLFPELEPLSTVDDIAARAEAGTAVIVLSETAAEPFVPTLRALCAEAQPEEILLVVGPEGGIADAEVERMLAAGARTAVLGPSVLRASTAGPVALALMHQELGRWG